MFDFEIIGVKGHGFMRGSCLLLACALLCPVSASHGQGIPAPKAITPKAKVHAAQKVHAPAQRIHRLVIQVDQNDPAVMNLALDSASNVMDHYRARRQQVDLDVVAFGPGLTMLRSDSSPVKDRIKRLKDHAFPSKLQFSACNNTKQGMEKKEGHPISLIPQAVLVPSGVVRATELQAQGWSYLRP